MEYAKPEITLLGNAMDAIQSSMQKDQIPVDSFTGSDLTATAAYTADE
jgi:hypothetical protein